MILILILILIIAIVGLAIVLPTLLGLMVDAYDEWQSVVERIKRRGNR